MVPFPTCLATKNPKKAEEWQRIALQLAGGQAPTFTVLGKKPKLLELQGDPILIAVHKAVDAAAFLGQRLLIEDISYGFDALGGFPGPLYGPVSDAIGVEGVLKLIEGNVNRGVKVTMTIAFPSEDGQVCVVYHELHGSAPMECQGSKDFGWDCIFIPDGYSQTFAQMPPADKDALMRGHAIGKLLKNEWQTYPRDWRGE